MTGKEQDELIGVIADRYWRWMEKYPELTIYDILKTESILLGIELSGNENDLCSFVEETDDQPQRIPANIA